MIHKKPCSFCPRASQHAPNPIAALAVWKYRKRLQREEDGDGGAIEGFELRQSIGVCRQPPAFVYPHRTCRFALHAGLVSSLAREFREQSS